MDPNKIEQTRTQATPDNTAHTEVLRSSIQGVPGAFHEIAARSYFRERQLQIVAATTFEELLQQVERGVSDTALMAIENSLAGSLMHNYTLLEQSGVYITGEVYLRIKQNLMALPGQQLGDLREVQSHPMALAQCAHFLRKHPYLRQVASSDTAESAHRISQDNLPGIAAIASTLAAEMYGLEIIAPGIETNKENYTRFLVLRADQQELPIQADKVSICFSVDHAVGSLYKVLAVLAAYNVNLSKIQSTPIVGRPWEYRFFVDCLLEGAIKYTQAIEAIRPITRQLKVLGAYSRGQHFEY